MVAGGVAEDRAGIRLRERLLFDPLVRHLLDPLHRVRAVAGPPAKARADADDRRALQGACAVGVAELVHPRGPGVAIHVDQIRVDEDVRGLAAERAGVAVHGTPDGAGDGRHPLESLDARAGGDGRDVGELGAGRGRDDVAVDTRLAPAVLQYDPADAPVGDE